ncbi:MAG: hypothetical protein A3B91_04265 [Candidatus Yanofskybacteria bacterium RIFCSPHIGHO2_02_FULL_41_29]|uniref:Uncharacterized protein n=1 Tax=Candidatus Yanofskybacteria bacterium RIFCSPHIGHO2_01_FULL_41_53 TaxID=1802663 RepID=A0A1F8EHX5_9BACT|nr:MAG: hypothetical protein A2650_03525 [Candidatus Yanofskybacteria bacterium RIFCSPHIGHO2_01_FULL_41_53]OGN11738.1 MAG: hypothetical protein A3B91_04265 [Candidatus Yanofskybacteria bacterium RIFCSPHIGHO2_02_FULL_41_29]OGN17503.1 MAG: hypothetical protein A3F48_01825 [Candidatus Yanofskybacteria bacterium RIFCSPHIGHO2_12_FULL_41_9]OGN22892.1 MAG: hypothetical protein A2916_00720 [Candidatus Yanofskybacteria bacterium RIFCSPLOWO2_01_FULL_41_67]OGN30274.1 MAG: hypothetical protein A3H54_05120 
MQSDRDSARLPYLSLLDRYAKQIAEILPDGKTGSRMSQLYERASVRIRPGILDVAVGQLPSHKPHPFGTRRTVVMRERDLQEDLIVRFDQPASIQPAADLDVRLSGFGHATSKVGYSPSLMYSI